MAEQAQAGYGFAAPAARRSERKNMYETVGILAALLVASICGTGALFLKWLESDRRNAEMKKELGNLQAAHAEEITHLKTAHAAEKAELQQKHSEEVFHLQTLYQQAKDENAKLVETVHRQEMIKGTDFTRL
jgi:hypothetical protein